MKIIKFAYFYESYLREFYGRTPDLAGRPYAEQKKALDADFFGWADSWSHALSAMGHEVFEVTVNAADLQRAWARENGMAGFADVPLKSIAVEQARRFGPDVVFYESNDPEIVLQLKKEYKKPCVFLGWAGSAFSPKDPWGEMDAVISCARESVDYFRSAGITAYQMHHAYDGRINKSLENVVKSSSLIFIGQIIRRSQFHIERDEFLEKLTRTNDLEIYCPVNDPNGVNRNAFDDLKICVWRSAYRLFSTLKKAGVPITLLKKIPRLGRAAEMDSLPIFPLNPKLRKFMKPGVFGLDMYRVIKKAGLVLNIHADSSPKFASNMRLFETTGVGTCLLTDWRDNLSEIFEPDREIVTYKSFSECIDKIAWLKKNPAEVEKIAAAGNRRTLADHTFEKRAAWLESVIKEISGKKFNKN